MTSDLRDSIEEVCMDHIQWAARRSFSEMEQEIVDKLVGLFEAELAQAVKEEKEKAKSWLLYCPNCKQTLEGIEIRRPEEKEWEATPGKVELTERRKVKSEHDKKKEEEK